MKAALALKRALDVSVATTGLAVLSPMLVAISVAVMLDSPGGPLFSQQRLGLHGRPFTLYKFRTMRPAPITYNADGSTRIDDSDARVTRVGRHLRGALDELPQLVNVLRGEMSLVGPRPDLVTQRALYAPGEERKLDMRPGITGLAVVLGRTDLPWKSRIAVDIRYVNEWNLALDLEIAAKTARMAFASAAPGAARVSP